MFPQKVAETYGQLIELWEIAKVCYYTKQHVNNICFVCYNNSPMFTQYNLIQHRDLIDFTLIEINDQIKSNVRPARGERIIRVKLEKAAKE